MPTIGADPEFLILEDPPRNNPPVISAEKFFGNLNFSLGKQGGIGRDGSRMLAEVRPSPSIRPSEVVANIGFLLEKVQELGRQVRLGVGSYLENVGGIGGHLHAWGRESTIGKVSNSPTKEAICLGLSLLWRLEDYDAGVLRRRKGYGTILDTRSSDRSREFRSPSSDWIAHPTLAGHTLSFFKFLVQGAGDIFKDSEQRMELIHRGAKFWDMNYAPPRGVTNPQRIMAEIAEAPMVAQEREGRRRERERVARVVMERSLNSLDDFFQRPIAAASSTPEEVQRKLHEHKCFKESYMQEIVREVRKVCRSKDLVVLDFFADRIHRLREDNKLIRLDLAKWRAVSCAD